MMLNLYAISLYKKALIFFLLTFLFYGCTPAPLKLNDSAKKRLKTVQLVTTGATVLEIVPDLLYSRMPVYEQYDNMVLPLDTTIKLYRLPGGLLVSGLVGEDDSVELVDLPGPTTGHTRTADWSPSLILSQEAIAQLDAAQIKTTNTIDSADAVLKLKIKRYKIFAGHISLQILIQLIDNRSGEIIARTKEETSAYEASVETLLAREGAEFKSRFRKRAAYLIAKGFQDIGLLSR